MLEEMTLNLFEAIPHAAFNIVDFAKGIGANFTANIGSAISNSIIQIIFFIVNIFIIPWLTNLIIDKWGGIKKIIEVRNNAHYELDYFKEKNAQIELNFYRKVFMRPILVITSWTSGFLSSVLQIPILLLSFNHPRKFVCFVDKDDEGRGIKGSLNFGYQTWDHSKENWLNPLKQVGVYLCDVLYILTPLAFPIIILYLLLPSTFSLVVSGLEQWVTFQSGTPNLTFFKSIAITFKDVLWHRLVLGGAQENIIFLTIYLVFLIFVFSDTYISLFTSKPEEGAPCDLEEMFLSDAVYSWPMISFIIVVFNVVFSLFNTYIYSTVSYYINSVGMVILFVILVSKMANILGACWQKIVEILWKIKK